MSKYLPNGGYTDNLESKHPRFGRDVVPNRIPEKSDGTEIEAGKQNDDQGRKIYRAHISTFKEITQATRTWCGSNKRSSTKHRSKQMMGSVLAICAPAQAVRCIVASPQALCDADATGKQMDKSKELAKMVFGGLGIKKWAGQKTVSTLHHVHPND